jgi:putative DNA primase/helicase
MSRPPRPDPVPIDTDGVPSTLRGREQWICWQYQWADDRDEWTKVPKDTSGGYASTTDSDTWTSFSDALDYHERAGTDTDGLGFVFSESGTVAGVDLDDCRDPDTGDLEDWAADVLDTVPTFAEVSPSGTGLHLYLLGFVPGDNRADIPDAPGHIEMYDSGRYFTVTGATVDDAPDEVRQMNDELGAIHAEYIASDNEQKTLDDAETGDSGAVDTDSGRSNPTHNVDKSGSSDLDDDELLEKAKNAENGRKFKQLWNGRTTDYKSQSEEDLALCGLLAFWTGGDRTQMDRLFRKSDLYRDKWDEDRGDDTYGELTINEAVTGKTEFYDPDSGGRDEDPDTPDNPDIDTDSHTASVSLSPRDVKAVAGVDEDTDIADLADREKAACVWDLIKQTDGFHVRVRRDNGSLWAYDDGVWTSDGERALRHAARLALGAMNYGQNVLTELKAQARSDPTREIDPDTFGLDPGHVAVENGRLDLEAAAGDAGTDAVRPLQPDDYALARLPVTYDPDAECEEWKEFVGEVVETEKIEAVQEYVGYCLHRDAMPFNKALLLVGSGSNGKSTFLNVVRALLGEEHTTTKPVHKFDEDNHVADLYGALANIDADLSEGSLSSTGIATFKRLVGGDKVSARKLYEDAFSFEATAKHLYACNQVPDVTAFVSDADIAFWRRWIVVQFPNYFPPGARDEDLQNRLTTDTALSAVLNWAVDGWDRLHSQGGFTNIEDHDETRRLWQSWGDSMNEFISEHTERDENADRISTSDAFRRYVSWCREHGKDHNVTQRRFTDALKQEGTGFGKHRIDGKVQRGYTALGFSDAVPEIDEDSTGDDGIDSDQSRLG